MWRWVRRLYQTVISVISYQCYNYYGNDILINCIGGRNLKVSWKTSSSSVIIVVNVISHHYHNNCHGGRNVTMVLKTLLLLIWVIIVTFLHCPCWARYKISKIAFLIFPLSHHMYRVDFLSFFYFGTENGRELFNNNIYTFLLTYRAIMLCWKLWTQAPMKIGWKWQCHGNISSM